MGVGDWLRKLRNRFSRKDREKILPFPAERITVGRLETPSDLTGLQNALLDAHNKERQRNRKSSLSLSKIMCTVAQSHANWMARKGSLSHTGENQSTPFSRLRSAGYAFRAAGENIASGYATVDAVMKAWMNSAGHRNNILSSLYSQAGFGIAKAGPRLYWCTLLAMPVAVRQFETLVKARSAYKTSFQIIDAEQLDELEEIGIAQYEGVCIIITDGLSCDV